MRVRFVVRNRALFFHKDLSILNLCDKKTILIHMYIEKKDAEEFSIPGGTVGRLYPTHPDNEQTVALVETDGVYPEKGFAVNDVCTETIVMLEGEFCIEYNGEEYILRPGDVLMILPKHPYRISGKGKVCVCITPGWDSAQNHIITPNT